jgi:DnaD/phage-associated family protein
MADEAENARPKGLLIPFDKLKLLSILDDKAFREVFLAMAGYVQSGTEPDLLEPIEQIAFESMRPFLNENVKTYQRAVLAHREAGRKGGRPKKTEDNQMVSGKNQMKPNCFSEEPNETNSPQSTKYKVQSTTDTKVSDITTVVVTQSSADVDLARIVQQYEAVIGTFPRSALDKLQGWREVFGTEMILLAINKAAESGKRSWNYINGILSIWQHSGIHTPGDAAASDENHKRPAGRGSSPRQQAESTRDQLARVLDNMDKERGFET